MTKKNIAMKKGQNQNIFWIFFTELPKETQIPVDNIIEDEKPPIAQEDIISEPEIIMEIS